MDQILARNLKKLRESGRYTQQELADALGITRSAYANYEAGYREMPFDIIEKASDFLGCEMALLFDDNANIEDHILTTAFRIDDLSPADAEEIRYFKEIVKSYLKMERLESR